jgi:hypothetical protein
MPCTSAGSRTFSITVRHGSRTGFWNTMPMSRRGAATGLPSTLTAPAVAGTSPARIFNSVVLPHPLGPTTVTNSRSRTESEMSLSAWMRSLRTVTKTFSSCATSMTEASARAAELIERLAASSFIALSLPWS